MSVSAIRPPRRRPSRDDTHQVALAGLGSRAAQIRYACAVLAQHPTPITVPLVRTWLAEHGVAADPDDSTGRAYVSRIVNEWRREHTPTQAPTDPTSATAEQTPNTAQQALAGDTATTDVHADTATDVHASVYTDTATGVHTDPIPQVSADDPATPFVEPTGTSVTVHQAEPAAERVNTGPDIGVHTQIRPDVHAAPVPDVHAPDTRAGARTDTPTPVDPRLLARSRRLRLASYLVLAAVAAAGAALSYQSLEHAAAQVFPLVLARVFPLLVDALIVGASLAYLAGAVIGRGRAGWRMTAHAGVAGTIALNALAAETLATVPWHIAAPIVWSALVELTARDLLGDYRATHTRPDTIAAILWITAPGESAATWLRVRRQAAHASTRLDVGTHAAAREALRMALPGRKARRVRRIIARQLRAGSITPQAVLAHSVSILATLPANSPTAVLRDVLTTTITPTPNPQPLEASPRPEQPAPNRSQLVKARPQDIHLLRTAIKTPDPTQPNQSTAGQRNPYIEITTEPNPALQNPAPETNSAISTSTTQESQNHDAAITRENTSQKDREPTPMQLR